MYPLLSLSAFLAVTTTTLDELPLKPQTPAATPLYREAFAPKGSDVLLSYPMDAKHNGKPVWYWKYHKRKLADLVITNALGQKLSNEKILKVLKKPTIVLVSSDGKPVHSYYLKVIKPETLVIIDKTRKREPREKTKPKENK